MNTEEKRDIYSYDREISEYTNPDIPYFVKRIRTPGRTAGSAFHWHQDIQLDLVLSGEITYRIGRSECTLTAGSGIFINAHTMHSLKAVNADYITVRFHPMLVSANPHIEKTYVAPIAGNPDYPYIFLDPEQSWKNDILESIRQLYMFTAGKAEDMPLLAESVFFTIWHLLYANLPAQSSSRSDHAKLTVMKQMISFIQNHYHEDIRLVQIAEAGAMSVSACSALFREIIHDSPYHYLMVYRTVQAQNMLEDTDLSITEISERCAFPDPSHFIRAFRQAYGMTPLQYRKSIKGKSRL